MITALEKLRALRARAGSSAQTRHDEPTFGPDDLPEPWRELYEERAAVREYHGGQAREHAEAEALEEVVQRMRSASDPYIPAGEGEAGDHERIRD